MRRAFIVGLLLAASGCDNGSGEKGLEGSFSVMISTMGKSDPDLLTITAGSGGQALLTFAAGITTDREGPNPDGLRATVGDPMRLHLASQPAHVDHSTGMLDGNLSGDGEIASDGTLSLLLHYLPTNSGTAGELDLQVDGTRQ